MSDTTGRDNFVRDVLHGTDTSVKAGLLRAVLTPLAGLHQVGLETYLLPYRTGIRKRYRLLNAQGKPVPVIAIGNLSSGGTGKTPMTALVAGHLHRSGKHVAILSRGHGSQSESGRTSRIVSDGTQILLDPGEAGDEPTLLAQLLPGVPVVVGRDRRASGRLAIETFMPDIMVCDDALQYWQLARDLNIVLLDACRPFDNGYVLPRGLLREPPRHLSRAGIVVLTRADRTTPEALEAALTQVRRLASHADVFTAQHAPQSWVGKNEVLPVAAFENATIGVFSGIADGAAFQQAVDTLAGTIAFHRDFTDHHTYTQNDIERLLAASPCMDAWLTTEKDLVKAAPLWPADAPPLYALRIAMQLNDLPAFVQAIDMHIADNKPAF